MTDKAPGQDVVSFAVSATFTAEPLAESLYFWGQQLQTPFKVQFAPYNQVFQQLLDPSSLLYRNERGINVVLIRFEDWRGGSDSERQKSIADNVNDFIGALKSATKRAPASYLVCVCPDPPSSSDQELMAFNQRMEALVSKELSLVGSVYMTKVSELATLYPVANYYDPLTDELGRVPYTPAYFAALGTLIARKSFAIRSSQYKVIALDCDQTLWKGVCGEDGPRGVEVDGARRALQAFMVDQCNSGMLLCLCSKNNEEDVDEVFKYHPDMPLKAEHIVSRRVNWQPKSANIKSMAAELDLGVDSFILIDDSAVECAEVQANCPEVLALRLPDDPGSIPEFLNHVWAFDHLRTTEEDKKRTLSYRQNAEREQFRQESTDLQSFLAGLGLNVQVQSATQSQFSRVAQLTQRTNQFNLTTIRRSESDIEKAMQSGILECLTTEVSDRFGDYGLVGVILFGARHDALSVDTLLLSCRAMGRGVEHKMLAKMGDLAEARGLHFVEVSYIPTKKNQPAFDFLNSIRSGYGETLDSGFRCRFPVEYLKDLTPGRSGEQPSDARQESRDPSGQGASDKKAEPKSRLFNHIATDLHSADQVLMTIEALLHRDRPDLSNDYVAPGNELERSIASVWQDVLGIDSVGVHDNFFEIGGTSLRSVQLIAKLNRQLGIGLTIVTIFEKPTISSMAALVANEGPGRMDKAALAGLARGEKRRALRMMRRV